MEKDADRAMQQRPTLPSLPQWSLSHAQGITNYDNKNCSPSGAVIKWHSNALLKAAYMCWHEWWCTYKTWSCSQAFPSYSFWLLTRKLDDGKVWERGYGGLIIIFLLFSLPLSLTGGEWYWSTLLRSESARDPKWVHMACKSLIIIQTHWDQRMFI